MVRATLQCFDNYAECCSQSPGLVIKDPTLPPLILATSLTTAGSDGDGDEDGDDDDGEGDDVMMVNMVIDYVAKIATC